MRYGPELGRERVGSGEHLSEQHGEWRERSAQTTAAQREQRAGARHHAHVQRDVAGHVQHWRGEAIEFVKGLFHKGDCLVRITATELSSKKSTAF